MANSLIIPKQLQKEEFRFVKLGKHNQYRNFKTRKIEFGKLEDFNKKEWQPMAKSPIEPEWQNKGYKFNDKRFLKHLENGNNYGVIGGYGNLRIWDFDDVEFYNEIKDELPDTFTVLTGSGRGYHVYFISDFDENINFPDNKGELRCFNSQVVGANSIHPTSNKYKVIRDYQIATIPKDKIEYLVAPYIKKEENKKSSSNKLCPFCNEIAMTIYTDDFYCHNCTAHGKNEVLNEPLENLKIKENSNGKKFYYISKKQFKEQNKPIEKDQNLIRYELKNNVINLLYKASQDKDNSASLKADAKQLIVDYILEHNNVYTIRDDKKDPEMFIYQDGIYVQNARTYIKEICEYILEKTYTPNFSNSIIARIEVKTYIEPEKFFEVKDEYIVPIKNGLFNLKTKDLMDFTPDYIFTNKLPITFDETAKYDQFEKFFNEVLKNPETDINVMQEWIGYCLIKNYKYNYATMFIGSGRNGKSVTLGLIETLLGAKNISSISLQKLEKERFCLADLYNKYANISADLSKTALKETGYFKQLTGQDPITVDRKFLSSLTFSNYAKMMFATNDLPYSYDDTDGFYDRWIIFEFPFKFVDKVEDETYQRHKDAELKEKLTTDKALSGLFNWALIGIERLLKNKGFSKNITTKENRKKWKRQSSSFNAFFEDHCEIDFTQYTTLETLKLNYQKYCEIHKLKFESNKVIKNILEQKGCEYGVKKETFGDSSYATRVWEGLILKNLQPLISNKQTEL